VNIIRFSFVSNIRIWEKSKIQICTSMSLKKLTHVRCLENEWIENQWKKDLFNTKRRFLQFSLYVNAYTHAWKIHRREPARTVPITRNKCELIKGRKQLLANKSQPLIRYSADKLNFSSRRQFSLSRALTGALREIGICETDVDVGARSHNWLWASAPASQSRSRTAEGGAKDEMDHSIRWIALKRLPLSRHILSTVFHLY